MAVGQKVAAMTNGPYLGLLRVICEGGVALGCPVFFWCRQAFVNVVAIFPFQIDVVLTMKSTQGQS